MTMIYKEKEKRIEDAEARSSNYLFSEQVKEIGFSGKMNIYIYNAQKI